MSIRIIICIFYSAKKLIWMKLKRDGIRKMLNNNFVDRFFSISFNIFTLFPLFSWVSYAIALRAVAASRCGTSSLHVWDEMIGRMNQQRTTTACSNFNIVIFILNKLFKLNDVNYEVFTIKFVKKAIVRLTLTYWIHYVI